MSNQLIEFLMNNENEKERALSLFWRNVLKQPGKDGCFVWTKKRSYQPDSPYGLFTFRSLGGDRFTMAAHRFSMAMKTGEDKDLCVCHKCDNPPCVKEDHLWYGTHAENMKDKALKGRGVKRKRLLEITEDIIASASEILDDNIWKIGRYPAMKLAIEYALDRLFQRDPDKAYVEEIKKLNSEIEKLRETKR